MNEKEKSEKLEKKDKHLEPKWLSSEGKEVNIEHVMNFVAQTRLDKDNEYEVIVGTDSHLEGKNFRFITVVCVYKKGKGGNYYYLRSYEPRGNFIGNQKLRMFNEVAKSLEIASTMVEKIGIQPVVHIDASPANLKHFTSGFSDQLKGYVIGSGFECKLKPESYVANAVADKHTK